MTIPANTLPPFAVGNYPAGADPWSAQPRREISGFDAWAATGRIPNAPAYGPEHNEWDGRVQEWIEYLRAEQTSGLFGDGSAGAVTHSAPASLTTALYATDLTIDSGAVLTTDGFPIYCTGTLTVTGAGSAIAWDGIAGSAGGTGHSSGVFNGGRGGGVGGASGVDGTVGVASSYCAIAGSGGAGGDADPGLGSPGAGAAGGLHTVPVADLIGRHTVISGYAIAAAGQNTMTGGGGGGGGGGGSGGAAGGTGGSGGGRVLIVARNIVLVSAGEIRALGGAGEDTASNAGAGGGGAGGTIGIVAREYDPSGGTVLVTGGNRGSASGAGLDGSTGSDGTIIVLTG